MVPLQHVRGLHPQAMFPGQPIHRQRLLDMILDPFHEPAKPLLIAPTGYPGTQCLTSLPDMLTAPQPFQTLQTRGISTPGQFVPGIAQKMDAAPLPQRGRQHFRDRMLQSLMTVRDHILDSPQATFLQMRQEFRPRPLASRFATSAAST